MAETFRVGKEYVMPNDTPLTRAGRLRVTGVSGHAVYCEVIEGFEPKDPRGGIDGSFGVSSIIGQSLIEVHTRE